MLKFDDIPTFAAFVTSALFFFLSIMREMDFECNLIHLFTINGSFLKL